MKKIILISFIASLILILGCGNNNEKSSTTNDNMYSRVIKNNTIKCGYITYPPGCFKDPNTGKLSGIFVETVEEAGKNLGLKIEWTEEVGWGSMIEGLNIGRYDIIGSPVWANSTRAKFVDFSVPLFYSGICIYSNRKESLSFSDLETINDEKIKISVIDGEMSDIIARTEFPKAQRVSHPQLSDNSQILLDVSYGKADITFVEPYIANIFLKSNPESIRNITPQNPIRIFPNCIMFGKGENKFKSMMDVAILELINSGFIDKLINKYQDIPGSFYKTALPYKINN